MKGLNTRLKSLENTGGDGTGSEVTSIEEGVIGDAGAKSSCLVTKKGGKSR